MSGERWLIYRFQDYAFVNTKPCRTLQEAELLASTFQNGTNHSSDEIEEQLFLVDLGTTDDAQRRLDQFTDCCRGVSPTIRCNSFEAVQPKCAHLFRKLSQQELQSVFEEGFQIVPQCNSRKYFGESLQIIAEFTNELLTPEQQAAQKLVQVALPEGFYEALRAAMIPQFKSRSVPGSANLNIFNFEGIIPKSELKTLADWHNVPESVTRKVGFSKASLPELNKNMHAMRVVETSDINYELWSGRVKEICAKVNKALIVLNVTLVAGEVILAVYQDGGFGKKALVKIGKVGGQLVANALVNKVMDMIVAASCTVFSGPSLGIMALAIVGGIMGVILNRTAGEWLFSVLSPPNDVAQGPGNDEYKFLVKEIFGIPRTPGDSVVKNSVFGAPPPQFNPGNIFGVPHSDMGSDMGVFGVPK